MESDEQAVAARLLCLLHAVFLSQLGTASTCVLAVVLCVLGMFAQCVVSLGSTHGFVVSQLLLQCI